MDWWEPETKKKYQKKAQCIIDQYGNYTVTVDGEVLNLNGITTQGENIADNGGVKEAYRWGGSSGSLVLAAFQDMFCTDVPCLNLYDVLTC